MELDKETRHRIRRLEKRTADLVALADTLQACLRRAEVALQGNEEYDYVFAQSAIWAMNEKL